MRPEHYSRDIAQRCESLIRHLYPVIGRGLPDDAKFGGSGVTNGAGRQGIPLPWQNQPCHVKLTLPPLGVVYLRPER